MRFAILSFAYAIAAAGLIAAPEPSPAARTYEHFLVGNPADVVRPTRGLLVLQGGGTDIDENYVRMGNRAGGGDFVVLRASGGDAYNPYIFALCACDSVETLVFKSREAASDPFVLARLRGAEALWIAGGDQSNYVKYWQGTKVEDAINDLARRGPVGGTSAGMAVMGELVYSAMSETSLTSAEGLADPYHADLTLAREFLTLPKMAGILTDQHLAERDRIGRTVAFLARLVTDGWVAPRKGRALAADRETALHVDPATGASEVLSRQTHKNPYVYFLRTPGRPEVCTAGQPLTYRNIGVYRLGPGGTFDLDDWRGTGGIAYTLTA